jgi:hypothetical protein
LLAGRMSGPGWPVSGRGSGRSVLMGGLAAGARVAGLSP